jgi:UDP-N-acetylmuramoyl-tripeptide--D-alanyl-D-alanine ligase
MKHDNHIFDAAWLACATGGKWQRMPDLDVERICHDTRKLQPGDLYVAIRGSRIDGHTLVEEAFRRGAVGALVDNTYLRASALMPSVPLLVVGDTLAALGRMAGMHRHRYGILATGITGSMGKTTVKDMTATLLREIGNTVCTQGNWNNNIGLPLSMLGIKQDTQYGVFELGMNHPGEIAPLADILSPDWGVVTSVGPVHLEFFESVEAIAHEKADLLRGLPQKGLAFLHAGDPYFPILREAVPCSLKTVALGESGDADLMIASHRGRLIVRERSSTEAAELPVPAAGQHNVVNAGLAILVARAAGASWEQIRRGFSQYQAAPMRWEMHAIDGYTVINDAYNANPVSMAAALETFAQTHVQGRKWLVLGDMLELGRHAESAHIELGKKIASGSWEGFVTVGLHAQTVKAAAVEAGYATDAVAAFPTVQDVGDWLFTRLKPADAVLLKGSRGVQLEKLLVGFGK